CGFWTHTVDAIKRSYVLAQSKCSAAISLEPPRLQRPATKGARACRPRIVSCRFECADSAPRSAVGNELRRELAPSRALWFTFGSPAASHFWKAFRMGYDTMPDKELKQRVRWDIYLLILRVVAMFFMA